MLPRLSQVQWLFLDPSLILNENDSDRELRRLIAQSLARRGRAVTQEQVERAWMQAISAVRPVHPMIGAIQLLTDNAAAPTAVVEEALRSRRSLDTLVTGTQLALTALQQDFRIGLIGPYRLPGTRSQLDKFHLAFPIIALSDELNLSHKIDASGKPDPALFTWALRKAACPPSRTAFASDRVDLGLAPAKLAGMTTVWVRSTNHKLRYPRTTVEQPDVTVNALRDLIVGS